MELETLIREVLREHAADAPTVVPELHTCSVRRWLYAGLAAAVVAGLAVGLALVRWSGPVPRTSTTPPANSSAPELSTPPGYTRIAYHDLTLAVPEELAVLTTPCSAPARYVFAETPGVAYSCPAAGIDPPQQTLTVRLTSADEASDQIVTTPTEIDGLSARIGYGRLDDFPGIAGQALFAAEDIALIVTAPDHSTVEQILTSVRKGPDPNGCPDTFAATADPPADTLIPGDPISAVRCVYARDGLQASLPVHPGAVDGLVRAINALPPGVAVAEQPPFGTELLRFDYVDGTHRTLTIELSQPTTYSDGGRKGYDVDNVITDQVRAATS